MPNWAARPKPTTSWSVSLAKLLFQVPRVWLSYELLPSTLTMIRLCPGRVAWTSPLLPDSRSSIEPCCLGFYKICMHACVCMLYEPLTTRAIVRIHIYIYISIYIYVHIARSIFHMHACMQFRHLPGHIGTALPSVHAGSNVCLPCPTGSRDSWEVH